MSNISYEDIVAGNFTVSNPGEDIVKDIDALIASVISDLPANDVTSPGLFDRNAEVTALNTNVPKLTLYLDHAKSVLGITELQRPFMNDLIRSGATIDTVNSLRGTAVDANLYPLISAKIAGPRDEPSELFDLVSSKAGKPVANARAKYNEAKAFFDSGAYRTERNRINTADYSDYEAELTKLKALITAAVAFLEDAKDTTVDLWNEYEVISDETDRIGLLFAGLNDTAIGDTLQEFYS